MNLVRQISLQYQEEARQEAIQRTQEYHDRWDAATEQLDVIMGKRKPRTPSVLPKVGQALLSVSLYSGLTVLLIFMASQGRHGFVLGGCAFMVWRFVNRADQKSVK